MRVRKFIDQGADLEFIANIASYFFNFICDRMMVQGKIENWCTIMDMSDVGMTQIPVNDLKVFMSHLQNNFRGRMFRTFVVFSPMLLRALWNIIWAWIDEYVQQKIIICGWYDA